MLFSCTLLAAVASVANAVPFKRYDNETTSATSILTAHQSMVILDNVLTPALSPSSSIAQSDFTTIITQYVTRTISGQVTTTPVSTYVATVLPLVVDNTVPASVASLIIPKTVTEFVTRTINGQVTTSAILTFTTSVPDEISTSTTTNFITVTNFDTTLPSLADVSLDACICVPLTTTVTVTDSGKNEITAVTGTTVTSYPVIGEFSMSGSTTQVTSYVEITLTETSYVTTATPVFTNYSNSTAASTNARRHYF